MPNESYHTTRSIHDAPTRFIAHVDEKTWWDGTAVTRVTCVLDLGNDLGVGFAWVDAGAGISERALHDETLLELERRIGRHMAYIERFVP
jgi:hypothetical protein